MAGFLLTDVVPRFFKWHGGDAAVSSHVLDRLRSVAVLTAIYFVAGKLASSLVLAPSSLPAVWPPAGIAFAALLLLGFRVWPGILLGALLVGAASTGSVATSIGIAVGSTLEALLGAYLVNRFAGGRHALDRSPDTLKLALLAGMVSPSIGASLGVTSLCLGGVASWSNGQSLWLAWWLADFAGVLVVAPVAVLWGLNPRLQWTRRQALEAALLSLSVVLVGLVVFGDVVPPSVKHYSVALVCIPVLVWPALRFGQREAATTTFALSGIALWGTWHGVGPFAWGSHESISLLQAFVGLAMVKAVSLAAVTSERRRFETRLVHLADHDALTDLLSWRRFLEDVGQQLAQARRYGTHGALLFLDLDDFKSINDSLGHGAGDALLTSVSGLLRRRLRDSDLLGRLGGDEFAVLLPHADQLQAQAVAGHLLAGIGSHSVVVAGRPIGVTVSVGIALFPAHGTSVEELLAHADLAMYQAKATGRNQFQFFAPNRGGQRGTDFRLRGEQAIREALETDSFLLHGQPILDLHRNHISQYELLLRMKGEEGQIVPPAAFLATAERSGLMHTLERWVVRQAIHLLAQHRGESLQPGLSVNISAKAFEDEELLPMIGSELAATSIDPASLTLEITESSAIADPGQAGTFASSLKNLGCRFALDDFGIGFSSLYHLKHLPVDYLKIDGSFIRDLPRSPVDQHLVKAIVDVSRALHKKTIAEYVGDAETVRLLRAGGVDYAQGFHIGKPRALSEIWPDAA